MFDDKNRLMALVASRALAKAERLDEQQTSRAMIASLVLGNPLFSLLFVRSMKPHKEEQGKPVAAD